MKRYFIYTEEKSSISNVDSKANPFVLSNIPFTPYYY